MFDISNELSTKTTKRLYYYIVNRFFIFTWIIKDNKSCSYKLAETFKHLVCPSLEFLINSIMSRNEILLNILTICVIIILPHTELIPNFGYSVPILLLVLIVLKYFNENFNNIGFSFKKFKPKSIIIGSLVAVLTLSFMQLIFFPTLENFIVFEGTEIGLHAFIKGNIWQYFIIIIMGWLVGGFYEEIVFHGFIFSRLEKMIKGKYATIIAFIGTAIIFGAYHYQLGVAGLINALIVGAVYLSLFLFFKRNLWYSIFCHGIYNSIVITFIYYGYL